MAGYVQKFLFVNMNREIHSKNLYKVLSMIWHLSWYNGAYFFKINKIIKAL